MSGRNAAVAIIPARGGSKRLPRKNILPFRGKPMIAWTIEAALKSGRFGRVVVSTEDAEIAALARGCGAEILDRPGELATDRTGLVDVLLHALESIDAEPDRFALLQPNCPLRTEEQIVEAGERLSNSDYRAILSVVGYGWTPPFRALHEGRQGLDFLFGRKFLTMSQDYPECFCPTGAVFFARASDFTAERAIYMPGLGPYRMPWHLGIDIDTPEDLTLANAVALCLDRGFDFGNG